MIEGRIKAIKRLPEDWRDLSSQELEEMIKGFHYQTAEHELIGDELAERQYQAELQKRGMERPTWY